MLYQLDEDTLLIEDAPGVYRGRLTDRWNVGAVPNGGYVLATGMAALRRALAQPDPISVTVHYLSPSSPGEVEIAVDVLKRGRQFCTATAAMRQKGREVARLLATYGDLDRLAGPLHVDVRPPEVPPLDYPPTGRRGGSFVVTIAERFELCLSDAAGEPVVRGWIRFADRRPMDTHCLGLIADAFPPSVFAVTEPGWVPTLELTVHVRAHPTSDTLLCAFRTRFLFGGLLEEDGEMWDPTGVLVAQSRQLAAAPRRV